MAPTPVIHGNFSNFGQKFSSCVAEGANNGATAERRVASRHDDRFGKLPPNCSLFNKTSAPRASDRAEIKRQFPEVYRECHAIADLADQWLRSGQIPTADEWATLTRRVHGISAIIDLWDEQATPYGLEI
jgi:hypothetical protein